MGPSFRKSRQRQIILDTLSDMRTHPTAQEIFARVREIDSQVGQATVYRNLRILKEQGEIIELSFEQARNVTIETFPDTSILPADDVEKSKIFANYRSLTGSLSEKGFQIDEWRIEAFGICQGCIEPNQPH